jgi:hypothetical protein
MVTLVVGRVEVHWGPPVQENKIHQMLKEVKGQERDSKPI